MLGTGGIVVIPDDVELIDALRVLSRFFRHETCGQCAPCREGAAWSDQIVGRFQRGEGSAEDFALMNDIMRGSKQRTICVFPEAFAGPLGSALVHFKGDFEKKIAPQGSATHG